MSPSRQELPDGGLQPRSAEDARRHPARSERCREVRGMLRDHADGDLPPRLRQLVEDHVHGCRDCGLALSRAELEVLRLREAFHEAQPRPEVASEEFTAAVMARVRAEMRRTQRSRRSHTTEGFTRKVMRGVKRQVERETRRTEEDRRGWRRRRVLLAAAVLLALLALVVSMPGGQATHVRVVAAVDAWLVNDAELGTPGAERLRPGSELPAQARVRTGDAGLLEFTLPALAGRGAGSRVRLEADSELLVGDANVLTLGRGRLATTSGGIVLVHLADGTKVELDAGASRLEAVYYHPFDQDLAQAPDLRVRLVVYEGVAQVWRGGEGIEVLEGRVAYFTSRTPVRQDRAVSEEMLEASAKAGDLARRLAEAARQPPVVEEPWLGQLLHPVTRQPVAGATVELRTHLGAHLLTTDSKGRFRPPDLPQLQGQFVVVDARAKDPSMLLGFGPEVLSLEPLVAGEPPMELVMVPDRRLSGSLLDPTNRPVPGVRLLPVLVDEALGLVQPLSHLARDVAPDGHFVLAGLPATLPPQSSLVLVAISPDRAPQVCFSSQGAEGGLRDQTLRLSVGASDPVSLGALPGGQELEVLQAVAGLPPHRLLVRRAVTSSPVGEAVLPHGAGDLWLAATDRPPQALVAGADGRLRPADIPPPPALTGLRATDKPGSVVFGAGQRGRFENVAEVPIGLAGAGPMGHVSVREDGAAARAGTLVFLSPKDSGETLFLGVCAGSPLAFKVPAGGYSLLALDGGGLGSVQVPAGGAPQPQVQVALQRTRSLSLPAEQIQRPRSGAVVLHLRRQQVDGSHYLTRQLPLGGTGELEGLVPGRYEIRFPDGSSVRRVVR